ncbi:hypothetical protein D0Y83_04780 [Qipengyuania flava]|uniref:Uncharacterized protein n=1 Tax=Qipengyuania flava TaxID=192812 RepID=A0A5P6N9M4_9SPHN|nr:hypothetical protein [Qipengyuania flava]QFI62665.1 hypothetical protein D0Y83_04780 [Qipengyuania flava]
MKSEISNSHGEIGHNSGANAMRIETLPLGKVVVWEPAQDLADDVQQIDIENEREINLASGQRAPLPARLRDDGCIEVVAQAHVLKALESAEKSDAMVSVRIFPKMSDAAAFKLLSQHAEPGAVASLLARGQLLASAVKHFKTEAAAADGCGVAKSTISKRLDVIRSAKLLGDKVIVLRDIDQRSASWLMSAVGRGQKPNPDKFPHRARLLDAIETVPRGSAKQVFAALRRAIKEEAQAKPRKGITGLTYGETPIGELRRMKNGDLRISLVGAGQVGAEDLVAILREAIAAARREG